MDTDSTVGDEGREKKGLEKLLCLQKKCVYIIRLLWEQECSEFSIPLRLINEINEMFIGVCMKILDLFRQNDNIP